ncbi:hypothetical protein [Thermospira aquatica]|uniref:Zinc ribbon domain-containing protein n=1 Tax=Thermospira aquatica TaxID=2828656 RepID=A0AAX3BH10_9SPIR|nr:hypothetical protein [Thermospira aquatica]URA11273.1 hypothetical protein KDW03_05615 [Thermospira aquatica]
MGFVKIIIFLGFLGIGLFFLFQTIFPVKLAFLWAVAVVGWFGFLIAWLYFTHQIHWLEDRVLTCPRCQHEVDITFLDGKPVFQRHCPYCGFDLSEHRHFIRREK